MQLVSLARVLLAGTALWTAAPAHRPAAAPRSGTPLGRLAWLAGCFEMRSADLLVEEQRMEERGASMLGMSRTTSSKGLVEYELTLVREHGGRLVYEARPSGQPAAVFTATVVTADSVVFAAPKHDYPQVVGYRRLGADSVLAWIDGVSRGRPRRIDFPYARVACPGSR